MIDWVPVAFVVFKLVILGTCMFFAVKWHYDQGQQGADKRALLRAGGKVVAVFVLVLVVLGVGTFALARMLGMDLNLP